MVNTRDFGKRMQEVMDFYTLSASAFADSLAIGRSSISHILSGRNKPSLEFVLKIVDTYPDVDLYWLLYGKGSFPKSEYSPQPPTTPELSITPKEKLETSKEEITDLFSQSTPPTKEIEEIKEEKIKHPEALSQTAIPSSPATTTKTIARVLICYTDGSFDTYSNI